MRRCGIFALAASLLVFTLVRPAPAEDVAKPIDRPAVDIVFCIDCSGSMGGVIESAKQKVWAIVNELATARPTPTLRIGLMGYGDADRQFRVFPLTDDLDAVYANLMTFKDEGWGDEYVGLMIHKATTEMPWSEGGQTLKVIYVVGNETARQGPEQFDYAKTAPAAIAKGIIVNAIYCGGSDETWREVARLADGQYLEISGDGGAVVVASPYDDELARLNDALNDTYLFYGARGRGAEANQQAQDQNASSFGVAVLAERVAAKSSAFYRNVRADLVDAAENEEFDLAAVPADELPEEMREMSPEQRAEHVEQQAGRRSELQQQIQELAVQRDAFVQAELEKQQPSGPAALDAAIRQSVRAQAEAKGFEFEQPPATE